MVVSNRSWRCGRGFLNRPRLMVTVAWRESKIDFKGWPYPGYWRGMQEVVVKK